jgi:hypothetical protein
MSIAGFMTHNLDLLVSTGLAVVAAGDLASRAGKTLSNSSTPHAVTQFI